MRESDPSKEASLWLFLLMNTLLQSANAAARFYARAIYFQHFVLILRLF